MQPAYKEKLAPYVPAQALEELVRLIDSHQIQVNIRRGRLSKLGDFRPARQASPDRISVNGNLNIYAFLMVFLHELAHLLVWKQKGRAASPHGKLWKDTFGFLLREFVGKGFFHPSLEDALIDYSFQVKAAGLGSPELQRRLHLFDPELDANEGQMFLEELPYSSLFVAANGRLFRKEDQLRKRFRCLCLRNKRTYLFHPMARVTLVENEISKSKSFHNN
ncbi:MAG: hypothetical protein RBS53_11380 [Bacteroidales bacterium]|jgi:hypothetical protein|nr:hypothetical protein [Bacteroidales bacterium]NLM93470.1 sprT domain-containing protein [Bacteroidales bacterium]